MNGVPSRYNRVDLGPIYETKDGLFCDSFTVNKGKKGKKLFTWKIRMTRK